MEQDVIDLLQSIQKKKLYYVVKNDINKSNEVIFSSLDKDRAKNFLNKVIDESHGDNYLVYSLIETILT